MLIRFFKSRVYMPIALAFVTGWNMLTIEPERMIQLQTRLGPGFYDDRKICNGMQTKTACSNSMTQRYRFVISY